MKTLVTKISAVLKDIGAVAKTGKNQGQGFMYRSIDEITSAIHPLLARHGLVIIPEVQSIERQERTSKNGGSMTFTVVRVTYHLRCTESDAVIVGETYGEAADSGDKSLGKALTYAYKKFLEQLFCLSPSEREDPDAFSRDEAREYQSTDEFKEIVEEIGKCLTTAEVMDYWNGYPHLRTIPAFKEAVQKRGKELKEKEGK